MPAQPRRRLAAVSDATPAPKKSVTRAAEDGDRRELLVSMRERIAASVDDPKTMARDLAALTRRLMEIAKEIESIDAAAEQEARDADESPDEAFDGSAI